MKEIFTLTELRKKNHYSQKELAFRLQISPSTICMYETGKRVPSLNRAIEISKFFEVPVENIIFKKNKKIPSI